MRAFRIPGGLVLLRADVNYFKNELSGKLAIHPTDAGAWHYHAETTEEWARQMCAEVIDEKKGVWINPKERANHAWDCSVYNLVAAHYLGVGFKQKGKTPTPQRDANQETGPSWLPKKSNWLK